MVIPSRPWQGAPAARAPLHPHRQTGLSDSPSVCPDASAAGRGNRSGGHRSRCNVWPLHHQSGGAFQLPRHPHDEGSFRAPLNPIGQPYAGWMRTIVFVRWITSRGVPAPCNPASPERPTVRRERTLRKPQNDFSKLLWKNKNLTKNSLSRPNECASMNACIQHSEVVDGAFKTT